MKLLAYEATLQEKMSEFDIWVTPSLGEIRDMPQFEDNLRNMKTGFDIMSRLTNNFNDISSCASSIIAEKLLQLLIGETDAEKREALLNSVFNLLFLVTGKTDNNIKCQFPLILQNVYGVKSYPYRNKAGNRQMKQLSRTIEHEKVTSIVLQADGNPEFQQKFLESYIHLIVSDQAYAEQLWSIGNAYCLQKKAGHNENALLSAMVIFQSRGSITATQGHIPENILRSYMFDWGLNPGKDYNLQDVELGQLLGNTEANAQIKKRKYDFILPYQSRSDCAKIFIQSQFYAGDSGSVSHKVVDQTDSSREATLKKYPKAVFIEYLDGAGYFSSLNGDLRKMLAKPTTKDYIQISSAPLKLRRELQHIRFLTILEVEHAIIKTGGERSLVVAQLLSEGYSSEEIDYVLHEASERQMIVFGDTLQIHKERESIARKYCLLDVIANFGHPIPTDAASGFLIVPGYSVCWGLEQSKVIEKALEVAPMLHTLWTTHLVPFQDIQWLLEKGFVKSK